MDKSAVKKWVEDNIEELKRLFGIPHWRIVVDYAYLDNGVSGEASSNIKYEHAFITLNSELIKDEEELERFFKHELLHIVHAPFKMLLDAIESHVDRDTFPIFLSVWRFSQEMQVKYLERMHHGHKEHYEAKIQELEKKMSKAHPGFDKVASGIAAKQGISKKEASAELAASTRKASPAARKANPNLKNVPGGNKKK